MCVIYHCSLMVVISQFAIYMYFVFGNFESKPIFFDICVNSL